MSFISTVYGRDGEHDTPYRTKVQGLFGWRLHKFHRADKDRAWHDHPNDFWTLPFTSYAEEVLDVHTGEVKVNIVKAFRWHFRPARYAHRLVGRADGQPKPYWTLVREHLPEFRMWGFFVDQGEGLPKVWIPWQAYIFGWENNEYEGVYE